MGFKQLRKNEDKQNNQNSSKGGIVSQMLMDTPLMQERANDMSTQFQTKNIKI